VEAGGTDDAVVVLGDTFAAESLAAGGAEGYGFAGGVIKASLKGEVLHVLGVLFSALNRNRNRNLNQAPAEQNRLRLRLSSRPAPTKSLAGYLDHQ
jgi:hypothetical protein